LQQVLLQPQFVDPSLCMTHRQRPMLPTALPEQAAAQRLLRLLGLPTA
jgi:hypothetical protein